MFYRKEVSTLSIFLILVFAVLFTASVAAQEKQDRSAYYLGPPLAPGERALNLGVADFALLGGSTSFPTLSNSGALGIRWASLSAIPVNSTIKRIVLYAEDKSGENISLTLRSTSQAGVEKQWEFMSTFGNSTGFRTFSSGTLSVVVQQWLNFRLRVKFPATTASTLSISLVRVIYEPPA